MYGRKFKRDINERKALFNGLILSLVMHESIQTTEEKAKAIKGDFEKLITKAKKGGGNAARLLQPHLTAVAAKKMIDVIAPLFATRQGGYTRIIRIGRRFNDDAQMVMLELVEKSVRGVKTAAKTVEKSAEKTEMALEAKVSSEKGKKEVKPKKITVKKEPKTKAKKEVK